MNRSIVFKTLFYDSQAIENSLQISFFTESEEENESVTAMTEDQAVRWLLKEGQFRNFFLGEFFKNASEIKSYFGLKEPFTSRNQKPGDIDLLLVDPKRPDQGYAFECKRVKALTINGGLSKVNNAEKVKHGVIQANKYQSLGFYKSFLMLILLDDGRNNKHENTFFRNTVSDQVDYIYDIPWNEPLNEDVGIVFIRVNQPTGKHINKMGRIGYCIDKHAIPLEQTTTMTNKIKELISL